MTSLAKQSAPRPKLSVELLLRVYRSVAAQIRDSKWFVAVVFALVTQIAQTMQGPTPLSRVLWPTFCFWLFILLGKYAWTAYEPERETTSLQYLSNLLRSPDDYTVEFARRTRASDALVVGTTIEVYPHPFLSTKIPPARLGWAPAQVELIDQQVTFDASDVMETVQRPYELSPHEENWPKFMLREISTPLGDDTKNLKLKFRRTDYVTYKSARSAVEESPDNPAQASRARQLREKFGNPHPHRNLVPHSVGLQYVVQFRGGDVLLLKRRSRGMDYQAGKWSISGEEQLQAPDFRLLPDATWLFQRAFCEEVACFNDKDPSTLDQRWARVSPFVSAMRMWAVFYEEYCACHQLFGYYELNHSADGFVQWYDTQRNLLQGLKDKGEGRHFVASIDELDRLLLERQCKVRSLFDGTVEVLRADQLHATSRYRLLRFLRAVYGDIPSHWRAVVPGAVVGPGS